MKEGMFPFHSRVNSGGGKTFLGSHFLTVPALKVLVRATLLSRKFLIIQQA
jgi:hypothetical protein